MELSVNFAVYAMRISSLLIFFSVQITLANSALTELVYDSSKTYSKGDAVVPSVSEFTLYTAKTSVPAGQNGPPNTSYWQTAEDYSTELQDTYSGTVSTVPSPGNINTSEISNLGTPQNSNQKKTLTLIANTGGSVSGAGDYDINQSVLVTATPGNGYLFANWSGDFSSTDASISIVVKANYSLTASFTHDIADTDGDSLTNYQEAVVYNTSSNNIDSDGDGILDGEEVNIGSNPASSDSSLINYFNTQISLEKSISHNAGYDEGKLAGQKEVIDEIIDVVNDIAIANDLNITDDLKSYSHSDFLTSLGTIDLASIQLVVEQFIDYSETEHSPYTDGWFYNPNQGWLWSDKSVYPYFFKTDMGWIYFKSGYSTPRFYNFTAQKWFSFSEEK